MFHFIIHCPTKKALNLGGGLLSHGVCHTTIGAEGLNFRVRDGNGCTPFARTTKIQSSNKSCIMYFVLGIKYRKRTCDIYT
jgi:hypothetical protein